MAPKYILLVWAAASIAVAVYAIISIPPRHASRPIDFSRVTTGSMNVLIGERAFACPESGVIITDGGSTIVCDISKLKPGQAIGRDAKSCGGIVVGDDASDCPPEPEQPHPQEMITCFPDGTGIGTGHRDFRADIERLCKK